MLHHSEYFYGNKISDYGLERGYVDYATLAKSFEVVLNNSIMEKTFEIGYWEQESGFVNNSEEIEELQEKVDEIEEKIELVEEMIENLEEDEEVVEDIKELEKTLEELKEQIEELEEEQDNVADIYQYYIVSDNGAEILKEVNEIVFYNEELDVYIWGVTHYGTSWDYVLTDIKLELDK